MPWVAHDDAFSEKRKVRGLTDKAYRLHFCALEHCARNLTDGSILRAELISIAGVAGIERPKRYVDELLGAGLWELTGRISRRYLRDGPSGSEPIADPQAPPIDASNCEEFAIHDYLEHNRSAAEIKEERRKNAERMRLVRAAARTSERVPARAGERAETHALPSLKETPPTPLTNNGTKPHCPECGSIHLPKGVTLEQHRANVHGIETPA